MSKRPTKTTTPPAEGPTAADRPESFLARWSRHKREAAELPVAVPEDPRSEPVQALPDEAAADRRKVAEANLPPIESLDEHSDYRAFLSADVSEELRRLALRKLFHLPQFNIVDGLDDYADDYTVFNKVAEALAAKAAPKRKGDHPKKPAERAPQRSSHDQVRELSEKSPDATATEPAPAAQPPMTDRADTNSADGLEPERET
jgi:hypothetical protein